jgi:hypothetical protein
VFLNECRAPETKPNIIGAMQQDACCVAGVAPSARSALGPPPCATHRSAIVTATTAPNRAVCAPRDRDPLNVRFVVMCPDRKREISSPGVEGWRVRGELVLLAAMRALRRMSLQSMNSGVIDERGRPAEVQ